MAAESKILNIEPLEMEAAGFKKEDLKGKVVLVTGGASNIGLGYARAAAWAGAKVVITDINEENGNEAERVINADNGPDTALFVKCDVTKADEVKNLGKKAFEKFEKVDVFIHNAMNMRLNGPVLTSSVDELDQSYAISARGMMLLIQEFVPGMIERKYGVVAYSATQFHFAPPMVGGTIYTSGKACAASLTLSLANEVKDTGVNVFCMTPAGVIRFDPSRLPPPPKDAPPPPKDAPKFEMFGMPGFNGLIPPEAGGAAMVYCIMNAKKLHGSGIIINDAFDAMNYPFPKPETAARPKGRRLSDMELTMVLCTTGPGFEG
ncbi:MAG: SDR family oxidoreductase [Oscillospiraceae bacterium]|nr:SDR family oxidoreductase [Oscillospiraceae bacterium]